MGLFGRSNADKIADNIREQAKFIPPLSWYGQLLFSPRFYYDIRTS